MIQAWQDDTSKYYDDEVIEWCKGYKQRKAQKAKIKEELIPVGWHPDQYWDWCVPEDKKRTRNSLCINFCKYSWESLKRLQRDLTLYSSY